MKRDDAASFMKLIETWEETYKKGQLTFWTLLALRKSPQYVGSLQEEVEWLTASTMRAEEQSLYRLLRKLHEMEIVEYETCEGHRGPDRKYYKLTKQGEQLLKAFIQRNILLFYDDSVRKLIEGKA